MQTLVGGRRLLGYCKGGRHSEKFGNRCFSVALSMVLQGPPHLQKLRREQQIRQRLFCLVCVFKQRQKPVPALFSFVL